jgi:outer membrane protein TolC
LSSGIRVAYGEVLAAARQLVTTEAQIETATTLLSLATERATTGSGSTLERDQAAVDVSLLTRQRIRDELQLERGRLVLAELVGMPPSDPLIVRGTLEGAIEELSSRETPQDTARRADIRASIARVAAAEARTRSTQAEARPNIGVFGQFMSMKSSFPQLGFSNIGTLVPIADTFHTISGGVSFMLPSLNRQQGAVAASLADTTAAARQLDRTRLNAEYQVALARISVDKAREAATLLRDQALARARANVEVLREAYTLGARPLSDVLAEIRRVQQIELEYTDALLEWYRAGVDLRSALGDLN